MLRNVERIALLAAGAALVLSIALFRAAWAQETTETTTVAWQVADVPELQANPGIEDVIAGGPGFIAVGGDIRRDGTARPVVWTSQDGTAWRSVPRDGLPGRGTMRAVVAGPDGFVAVGGRQQPLRAVAWRSADGIGWRREPSVASARGSLIFDVASTPDGLVAVGARCATHCLGGLVWTSADGSTWDLAARLPFLPRTVATLGRTIVVSGDTIPPADGPDTFRGITATSTDAVEWQISDDLGPDYSGFSAVTARDGSVIIGGTRFVPIPRRGLLYRSTGDSTLERITHRALRRVQVNDVDTADGGLLLLTGARVMGDRDRPVALWSPDARSFSQAELEAGGGDATVAASAFSDDSATAVALGVDDGQAAAWYATVQTISQPAWVGEPGAAGVDRPDAYHDCASQASRPSPRPVSR